VSDQIVYNKSKPLPESTMTITAIAQQHTFKSKESNMEKPEPAHTLLTSLLENRNDLSTE
jgi:hypothetical protein